jgi:hypothetical protein
MQKMAGSFPFIPELFPASAPEPSGAGFQSQFHGTPVGKTQHQNLFGIHVLNNNRNQF